MGICNQIHDRMPTTDLVSAVEMLHNKYPFTLTQLDTIKDADRTLRFDVQDIVKEWRIVDMMCECMNLVKELEEMKHYGMVSRAA